MRTEEGNLGSPAVFETTSPSRALQDSNSQRHDGIYQSTGTSNNAEAPPRLPTGILSDRGLAENIGRVYFHFKHVT